MLDRNSLIRLAASLPKGDARRRQILAELQSKMALAKDTEDFIEWVLATKSKMAPAAVERYVEQKLG